MLCTRKYFVHINVYRNVCLWDIRKMSKSKPKAVKVLPHEESVDSALFSPVTGNNILTCSDNEIRWVFLWSGLFTVFLFLGSWIPLTVVRHKDNWVDTGGLLSQQFSKCQKCTSFPSKFLKRILYLFLLRNDLNTRNPLQSAWVILCTSHVWHHLYCPSKKFQNSLVLGSA